MKIFLYAFIAAVGNAIFVYGQRGTQSSDNPYFFLLATLTICISLFLIFALTNKSPMDSGYIITNWKFIAISGVGFFITFIGFYWLYNEHGATNYIIYALLSILTTSIGVGLIIFREPFNKFHIISALLAVAAIICYGIGQQKLVS